VHPEVLGKEQRKELYWRCWDRIPNPEWYLSRWFSGARIWEVRRDNVAEFFRWALLNRGDESVKNTSSGVADANVDGSDGERDVEDSQVKREEQEELDEYVDGIQTLLGRRLEPGRGTAKSLRISIDEVKMLHRPAVWYLVCPSPPPPHAPLPILMHS
jgi:hypothetical protein